MAEVGRRTVIIRGQVVDRYSPRRSMVEADFGERRSHDEFVSPGYRPRTRRQPADLEGGQRRSAGYEARRSAGSAGYEARPSASYAAYDGPPSAGSPAYETRRAVGYAPRRSAANDRRRRRPYDAPRARPDRIAMWAVLLGVVLLLAAATGSHAAMIAHAVAH